jgi:hypothetical protein
MTFEMNDGVAYLGTQCPSAILTIKSTDPMQLHNGKYTMHLEVDEDTYWGLIKLGAEIKTDCETYAENILLGHVESEFDRKAQD